MSLLTSLPLDALPGMFAALSVPMLAANLAVLATMRRTARRLRRARLQAAPAPHHDPLTGLPSRSLFRDRLDQSLALAGRERRGLALLCLDLDRFKQWNDLLGHEAGDALMVEVANRLTATARDSDTVARLGSDEFAIVQPLAGSPREAWALAQRVVAALAEPFFVAGQTVLLGGCVGVALHPADGAAAATLVQHADIAVRRAKQEGPGSICFFEPAMDMAEQARRELERDLRHALGRGELLLHYQPLFDSRTLRVIGYEALLRWRHPTRGAISPAEFIPLAEECGLIAAIGEWVLRTACAEAMLWPRPARIAVNLSPLQFRRRDLAANVAAILAETGLPATRLELEVTEGVLIDDACGALDTLQALRRQGIRIALDDFGTGYSSLSYLRRFPFDKLKIDRSFVRELGEDRDADAIVRSILALCRSLQLDVTAEGVETPEQLALLREQECGQVQGFLLGRPVGHEELEHAAC